MIPRRTVVIYTGRATKFLLSGIQRASRQRRTKVQHAPKGARLDLNKREEEATMEQIKSNPSPASNFEARTVKDIIEPAKSIFNKVSVKAALEEMQAQATDSSPVIDQRGELLGTVSKNQMNRKVGGFGHDPKTEPVEAQIETNNPYCFEDQTVAEIEKMMLDAQV